MTFRLGLILAVALVSISSTALVVRYVDDVPALVLAFWRMLTASSMLWAYSAFRPKGRLSLHQKKLILLAGFFLGCHFACFFLGVRHTSISNATFLGCMVPIFTVFIAFMMKKEINRMTYVGLGIALLGAGIIQFEDMSLAGENMFGNSIALLGAFFIAITFVIASKVRETTDIVMYGRLLFFVAAVTLLLIAIMVGDSVLDFNKSHIPWFLFLGFVPSILGHNLLNYAIKYVTPTAITSIPLGEPIIASLFGFLLFQEAVPAGALMGGPVILIGIYLILKNQDPVSG